MEIGLKDCEIEMNAISQMVDVLGVYVSRPCGKKADSYFLQLMSKLSCVQCMR
jgi:hypothetical protein